MLIRPRTPTPSAMARVASTHAVAHVLAQGDGRQHAGGVAGVDAGLLDVLHDAADVQVRAVEEGVDVDLDGVLEEAVHQHRVVLGDLGGVGDVAGEVGLVVDDLHAAAAQHVGRADQDRVADLVGDASWRPRRRRRCRSSGRSARRHPARAGRRRGARPGRWPPGRCPGSARRRRPVPARASAGSARRAARTRPARRRCAPRRG